MPLYLDKVNSDEWDEIKAFGAIWDDSRKKWFVRAQENYWRFRKWILRQGKIVICDHFYIIEGKSKCYKCRNSSIVIGFGIENFFEFGDVPEDKMRICFETGTIQIIESIGHLSLAFSFYLKQEYNYFQNQNNTYLNHCANCGAVRGNYYLFEEEDSPFCVDDEKTAEKLTLKRVKLQNDIITNSDYHHSFISYDYYIKNYSKFIDLNKYFNL
ncbi:MAG: hypothetical protein VB064_12660 [Oscillospiraceae bacterium]|nr:hypothetical protein [Oscillospiraceae bacterium]